MLQTSIVGPTIFSFPFAFSLLGWLPGILSTALRAMVTFCSYNLLSVVSEHHAQLGKRQLRFRDMARDILGEHNLCQLETIICSNFKNWNLEYLALVICRGTNFFTYNKVVLVGARCWSVIANC